MGGLGEGVLFGLDALLLVLAAGRVEVRVAVASASESAVAAAEVWMMARERRKWRRRRGLVIVVCFVRKGREGNEGGGCEEKRAVKPDALLAMLCCRR